jgi:hypothetical protein
LRRIVWHDEGARLERAFELFNIIRMHIEDVRAVGPNGRFQIVYKNTVLITKNLIYEGRLSLSQKLLDLMLLNPKALSLAPAERASCKIPQHRCAITFLQTASNGRLADTRRTANQEEGYGFPPAT